MARRRALSRTYPDTLAVTLGLLMGAQPLPVFSAMRVLPTEAPIDVAPVSAWCSAAFMELDRSSPLSNPPRRASSPVDAATQLETLYDRCVLSADTIGNEVVKSSWQLTNG
jgi:hypothetical protein